MTSAHVDVLTAEVRALMIGNRQVTLSVYRQLDTVEPDEIEPFGRVRDSKDGYSELYVIGRHKEGGALVRSSCPQRIERPGAPPRIQNKYDEANRRWRRDITNRSHGDFMREVEQEQAEWVRVNIILHPNYASWSELPLIVLAGLR
jgi:hypothetical protein